MLPICKVCLRTDRKLQIIEDSLDDFYDELCDYAACQVESVAKFCSECAYMLRKFNAFKERCRLAIKVIKSWKIQKSGVRQPITVLASQIPSSPLNYGKKENYKVYEYFYQDLKEDPEAPVNVTNYIYTYIADNTLKDDIPTTKLQPFDYNIIQNECLVETDIKTERDIDNTEDNMVCDDHIEYNIAQNKIKTCDDDVESDINFSVNEAGIGDNEVDVSGCEVNSNGSKDNGSEFGNKLILQTAIKTESDLSDDEILATKRTKTKTLDTLTVKRAGVTKLMKNKKKRRKAMPLDLNTLKENLAAKFADNDELKDEDGAVLDKNLIINSIDKMPLRKLKQLWNNTGTKTFTPEAMKLFVNIQKKYSDEYSTVFITEHLPSKELVEAEFRKRQDDASYAAAEHKCELCYRGFKHYKLLEFHIRVQHDESRAHACRVCRMRFASASSLRWHTSSHSTVFRCKLCPLVTNYKKTMLDHYHYHNGDVYKCPLCQATFKSRSGLSLHNIRAHPTRHACGDCGRAFASARGLAAHRRLKHRNEAAAYSAASARCAATARVPRQRRKNLKPNFICPVCKITEHSNGALSWHFRAEHPTLSFRDMYSHKYLCHICGKGYSSPRMLADHKNVHTGAKPYACPECPAAFGSSVGLRLHAERHLPRARVCPHCGKKFVSASNLSNHMKQHSGLRKYKCQLCEKSFIHSNSLNEHVRGVHYHIRRSRRKATGYMETEQEDGNS